MTDFIANDENITSNLRRSKRTSNAHKGGDVAKPGASHKRGRSALGDISNANHQQQAAALVAKSKDTTKQKNKRRKVESIEAPKSVATQQKDDVAVPMSVDSNSEVKHADDDSHKALVDDLDLGDVAPASATASSPDDDFSYRSVILDGLRLRENTYRVNPEYMATVQNDVNHQMRSILVDWMVEVAEEYRLRRQTLYLTVNYIDRLLSTLSVSRTKLQLVGVTAMFVAAKYEEIYPPSVDEFVDITDNTYTRDQVFRLEGLLLKHTNFNLTVTTPCDFWPQFSEASGMNSKTSKLAQYILELNLLDKSYNSYSASMLTAASMAMAMHMTNTPWTPAMEKMTGYSLAELKPCADNLLVLYTKVATGAQTLKAIKEKYSSSKHHRVSSIAAPASLWS